MKIPKTKRPNPAKLKKKLDKLFSKWVRDKDGNCFTCDRVCFGSNRHAAHFITRGHMSTRWNPVNVQIGCYRCNINLYGNQYEFGLRLDKKFGQGTAKKLYDLSRQIKQWNFSDLLILITCLEKTPEEYEKVYYELTNQ